MTASKFPTMRWIKSATQRDEVLGYVGIALIFTMILVLVLFAGSMAGSGPSYVELLAVISLYSAIVGSAGFGLLGSTKEEGGAMRATGWFAVPFALALLLSGRLLFGSIYSREEGVVLLVAGLTVLVAVTLIYATARVRYERAKKPFQQAEQQRP